MEPTIALAAQGEDNFARSDLALLEISAGDHRIEVLRILDNNKGQRILNKRPNSIQVIIIHYIPRFLAGSRLWGQPELSRETNAPWSKNEIRDVERQQRHVIETSSIDKSLRE